MSVTNCDAHFFMLVIYMLFARQKEVLILFLGFFQSDIYDLLLFFNLSIMRQYLYNNQVVYDSSSLMDLSIVP